MAKLTISDLKQIKEKHKSTFTLREGGYRAKVTVHMGTCGIAAGARNIVNALMDEIGKSGADDIIVTTSGCAGLCSKEPMVTVEILNNPPVKYKELTEDGIREIFREHVLGGKIVDKFALVIGSETTY
ncbi:MAG: (2Fe-2S) ferredoxin domain-containing protein [Nitrospirae bacterium]|nr:(2Fe-2S) ferredoxin domain-containing protein [Nitrospirota bacterium]